MRNLSADLRRCFSQGRSITLKSALKVVLGDNHGVKALLAYRLGRWLLSKRRNPGVWLLWPVAWPAYYLVSSYARFVFDIHLELSADIGPGLYIGHFGGIVLRNCRVGAHCSISQSTQIMAGEDGVPPVIGDRVWIGAQAKIIGPMHIGAGSTVSAGSVVRRDVPERTLYMGNPGRIVMRDYDNSSILGITS